MNSRNQIRARMLRAALLAGAGSTLLIAAAPAMAQDAPAPQAESEEDAIVVTGIRETIQNSINTKREETAIVDALSADDIGDLPALSVGQAISDDHRRNDPPRKGRRLRNRAARPWSFLSNALSTAATHRTAAATAR